MPCSINATCGRRSAGSASFGSCRSSASRCMCCSASTGSNAKRRLLRSGQYRSEPRALERECPPEQLDEILTAHNHHMRTLVELVGRVTERPLVGRQSHRAAGRRRRGLSGHARGHRRRHPLGVDDELYLRQRPSGASIRRCTQAGRRARRRSAGVDRCDRLAIQFSLDRRRAA